MKNVFAKKTHGFARTDVLVLVVICAVAIATSLVASAGSRSLARSETVGENLRLIGEATALHDNVVGNLPPSYVFGASLDEPIWRFEDQGASHPAPMLGYIHVSEFLGPFGAGYDLWASPSACRGGAPRTNPGADPDDWEPGQVNGVAGSEPSEFPRDFQSPRVAFAANGAVMPRNRFNANTPRGNRLVALAEITKPSATIAFAEFASRDARHDRLGAGGPCDWRTVFSEDGVSLSHRPVTPFLGLTSGVDVYNEPDLPQGPARFAYPSDEQLRAAEAVTPGLILDPSSRLNVVTQHRDVPADPFDAVVPADDAGWYSFLDGSARIIGLRETIGDRLWGERFYSITGDNRVR